MRIRVEIDKKYVGIIRYQLSYFNLTLLASEFTDDYAVLYFDVLPNTIHTIFFGNEIWQNSFSESINDLMKKSDHFSMAFAESTASLSLPHYQSLDDEDIFIEVMFPKGALYSLKSIVDINITFVNQSADNLIIEPNNIDKCTLRILDGTMKEKANLNTLGPTKKLQTSVLLKPEETFQKQIQFKLNMKNSGYYYFVLKASIRPIFVTKAINYTFSPLQVLIK